MGNKKTTNNSEQKKLLTETELELMQVLWRIGEGTVHQVLEGRQSQKTLAYTSVSTILRILEQKKIVGSRKQGRGHIYYPLVSKREYETSSLNHLVTRVFQSTPSEVVRKLVDETHLSKKELREIRELLDERLG